MTYSQREAERKEIQEALGYVDPAAGWRQHRYKGGPPPLRTRRMQLAHETRARKLGIPWDMVDLRVVYARDKGLCGICGEPVAEDVFTIDHIIPTSRRGPHILSNLQIAHHACNSRKGDT